MTLRSFDNPDTIDARQFLLDRRCERTHPKRHRTQKRASALHRKKRLRAKRVAGMKLAAAQKYHAAVRAYWMGERDEHP